MDTLKRNGPMLFGILVFVGLILLGLLRPDKPDPPPTPAAKGRWASVAAPQLIARLLDSRGRALDICIRLAG